MLPFYGSLNLGFKLPGTFRVVDQVPQSDYIQLWPLFHRECVRAVEVNLIAVADAARLRVKAFSVDGFEKVKAVVDFLKRALKRDHVVSVPFLN